MQNFLFGNCKTVSGKKCRKSPDVICGQVQHEEVGKDVLKEECSIVPRKEYANVPSDECKNITEVDTDPSHQPVQLGEHMASAWEELDIYKWDTEDLWDNDMFRSRSSCR